MSNIAITETYEDRFLVRDRYDQGEGSWLNGRPTGCSSKTYEVTAQLRLRIPKIVCRLRAGVLFNGVHRSYYRQFAGNFRLRNMIPIRRIGRRFIHLRRRS